MAEVKPLVMEVGDETFVITQNNDQDDLDTNEVEASPDVTDAESLEDDLEELPVHFDINFECHLCDKKFSNNIDLRSHLDKEHVSSPEKQTSVVKRTPGHIQTYCTTCGLSVLPEDLEAHKSTHIKTVKSFHCLSCNADFDIAFMKNHRGIHAAEKPISINVLTDQEQTATICTTCGIPVDPKDLDAHNQSHQKPAKSFHCLICQTNFQDIGSLTSHRKVHAAEKQSGALKGTSKRAPILCTICGVLVHIEDLESHSLRHKKSFHCFKCKSDFTDSESLENHKRSHTAEKTTYGKTWESTDVSIQAPSNIGQQQNTKHAKMVYNGFCKLCKLYFSNVETFMGHMKIHGKPTSTIGAGSGSTFECGYCQQKFDSINETRFHLDSACLFCPINIIKRPSLEMYASLNSDLGQQCFSIVLRDKPVVIKQVEKYMENPLETLSGQVSDKSMAKQSSAVAMSASGTQTTRVGTQPPVYASVGLGNQVKNTTVINPALYASVGVGNQVKNTTVINQANVGRIYKQINTTGMQQNVRNAGSGNQANRNTGMTTTILLTDNQPHNNTGKQQKTFFFLPSAMIQKQRSLLKNVSIVNKPGISPQPVTFTQSGNQAFISPGVQPTIFPNKIVKNQANISAGTNPPSSVLATQLPNPSMMASTSAAEVPEEAGCTLPTRRDQGMSTSVTQGPWSNVSRGNNGSSSAQHPSANSGGKKAKLKCGYCDKLFHSTVSIRQHQRDEHALDQLNMAGQTDAQIERRESTERTTLTVGGALSFNSRVRKGNKKKNKKTDCRSVRKSSTDTASDFSDEPEIEIKTEPNTDCPDPPEEKSLQDDNTCDICFHTFCSVYNVQRHKKLVHGMKSGAPEPVNQSHAFPSIRSVFDRAHLYQRPDPILSQRIKCASCGKTFAQKKGYKQHQRYHCKGKRLTAGRELKCQHCGITFKHRKYLRKHHFFRRCKGRIERTENEEQIIQCDVCGRIFADKSGLTKHKRYHCLGEEAAAKLSNTQSNSPQFKCDCGQKFTQRSSLQRHKLFNRCKNKMSAAENSESDDEEDENTSQDIKCDCGQTFTLKSSLQRHKLFNRCKNKMSAAENSESDDKEDENTSEDIKCDCGQTFTLKSSLQRHKLLNRCKNKISAAENSESDDEEDENTSQDIKCDCGQTFTLKSSLQRHKLFNRCKNKMSAAENSESDDKEDENTSEDIKCDCGQTFTLKSSLQRHKLFNRCKNKTKTTGVRDANSSQTIRCDDCGRTFSLQKSLRKHQMFHCAGGKAADENDDECTCSKCGKVFLHADSLRKHFHYRCKGHLTSKSVSIEKTNFCGICGKNFLHKDSLRKHKLYHCKGKVAQSKTSDKKIECGECRRTFSYKESLVRHQKFSCKTKEIDSRKYVCNCGSSYYSKDVYMRHKKYICKIKSPAKGQNSPAKKQKSPAKEKNSPARGTEHACDVCGKVYMYWDSVVRHKKTNCKGSTMCDACGKSFEDVDSLRKHKRFYCTNQPAGSFPCGYCERYFNDLSNRRRHENNLHKIKSPHSRSHGLKIRSENPKVDSDNSVSVNTNSRKITSSTSPVVTLDRFLCHLCKKSFVTMEMLRKHKDQDHEDREMEKINTPIRQMHFSANSSPEKSDFSHIIASPQKLVVQLTKIDDDPNQASTGNYKSTEGLCFVCGHDFHRQCKLKIHLQTCLKDDGKSGKKSVGDVLVNPPSLREAEVKRQSSREAEVKLPPSKEAVETERAICVLCGNSYYDHSTMLRHRKKCERFQSMSSKDKGEVTEKSVCDICGNSYYSKGALTRHKMLCVLPKPSSIKKVIPNSSQFKSGIKQVTKVFSKSTHMKSGIKKVTNQNKCDLCGNKYSLKGSLVRHRKKCAVKHAKARRLQIKQKSKLKSMPSNGLAKCKYCRRLFHPKSLCRHIKNIHGTKMNKSVPGKSGGKSPASTKKNLFAVTSGNLYPCDLCDKAFVHRFNVHRHKRISHPTEHKKQLKLKAKYALKAQKNKSPVKSISSPKLIVSPKTEDETLTCKFCGKVYSTVRSVARHIKQAHVKELSREKKKENLKTTIKQEPAPEVSETKSSPQISRRRKIDINMYESYTTHLDKKAKSDNEPKCDVCGAVFMHKKSIKKHMRRFHPEEFNKMFQATDSKTSDNLEETTTIDDGQEELKTTISADHINKGSPLEATAGVDVELEGKSTDGVEDQDKHSVDKDSLTEQQDDCTQAMEVDDTCHNDCIDNKESTIGLPDDDMKDNTDGTSQQEESACPMEVEEVPESSPRDTIKSLEDKDEVTSEREDLGESNSKPPSSDEAVDITRHSDGEKTQEAKSIHTEGHSHLDGDDEGHLINEHDKVTSHHSDREKDDQVEQNPESSSHLAPKDNESVPCKDKEKCTETNEEEIMESEGIEVQADEEIHPCNDKDLSDENEETASDPEQEDEDNLSLNEEIKNSNEVILHEEEIPKNDEVPQHEQNTQNVIEDNPQNNEETSYQEEADSPPHEEEIPEIDEEENQEIDDKVNKQIDEDQNPHQNQHDADFVEEDNPKHVEDNPGHNEEDNPKHVEDNPGHNEEDNPKHVEDNPGHNEEDNPEHVEDNPEHNEEEIPEHVEDNPGHNEKEIPEHVEDNPGHNKEEIPEHVEDNPGHNEEEIPQGLEANSSLNNVENSPQNNEENISQCDEDDKPQSNEEESSQPDEESNPQSNDQDSLQNDKDTPQPDDLSVYNDKDIFT